MPKKSTSGTQKQRVAENEELRARLDEAEETLRTIRSGKVDGEQIFNLEQTEQAQRESEYKVSEALEFNRKILNTSSIGILTYKKSGQCVSANAAAAKVGGATVAQLLAQNFHEIPCWKKSGMHQAAIRALDTGIEQWMEVRVVTTFGKDVWLDLSFSSFDSAGERHLLVFTSDVTGRKQAEKALKKEHGRMQQYLDVASVMFLVLSADRKVILINKKGCEILGYEEQEIVGRSWYDFLPQDEKDRIASTFDQVMAGEIERMEYFENPVLTKSGQERLIAWHNSVLTDEEGRIIGVVSSGEDITERKLAEEALRNREGMLQKIFDILPVGLWLADKDGKLLRGNPAGVKIWGAEPQVSPLEYGVFKGRRLPSGEEVAPDDWALVHTIQDQVTIVDELLEIDAFDGKKKTILNYTAPVLDAQGDIQGAIVVNQDITERKQAEDRLRRQLEHLTALSAIDRVIAAIFDLRLSLSEILNHATKELGVDAADILILNSNSSILEYGAERGFRTNAIRNAHIRLSESYAGRAVLERHIIQIQNLRNEPNNLFVTPFVTDEDFVCYYGVPLIIKGQVKGVLEVYHRASLEPDAEWFGFLNALAGRVAIAIENATLFESLQRSNSELTMAYDATIEGWSQAMDLRDKETEGHTQRVTEMTVKLAGAFGLGEAELVQVRWGALLHDIGKMGVPDGILLKPGPLTDEEWAAMKKHPAFANEMLAPIRYLRLALDIPYCHHEKWDGTGYPRGLKGTQIPLAARIFAVVDVWDALRSDRPYRAAWTEEKVREHIHISSGTHFDPQVVEVFMQNPNLMLMHPPPGGLGINAPSTPLSS